MAVSRESVTVANRRMEFIRGHVAAGPDTPIFVIEAACGWHAAMYQRLVDGLSNHGVVLAYDRGGYGGSDPSPGRPDAIARADELNAFVDSLALKSPIYFIGHSIAGLYLRVFVHRHPFKASGLILLDATHPDVHRLFAPASGRSARTYAALVSWAERFGLRSLPVPTRNARSWPWRELPEACARDVEQSSRLLLNRSTEYLELSELEHACDQADAAGQLGDLPLLIITAAKRRRRLFEPSKARAKFLDQWRCMQSDLAQLSTRARHIVLEDACHEDMVTDARHASRICAEIIDFIRPLGTAQGNGGTHV